MRIQAWYQRHVYRYRFFKLHQLIKENAHTLQIAQQCLQVLDGYPFPEVEPTAFKVLTVDTRLDSVVAFNHMLENIKESMLKGNSATFNSTSVKVNYYTTSAYDWLVRPARVELHRSPVEIITLNATLLSDIMVLRDTGDLTDSYLARKLSLVIDTQVTVLLVIEQIYAL